MIMVCASAKATQQNAAAEQKAAEAKAAAEQKAVAERKAAEQKAAEKPRAVEAERKAAHQKAGPLCHDAATDRNSKRKFLVFTNAGDHSSVASWLKCGDQQFDLFINFYGNDATEKNKLRCVADRFHERKGFKHDCLIAWLKEEPNLLDQYDAVAVLDDDMQAASSGKINAMFHILIDQGLFWASPTWTGS